MNNLLAINRRTPVTGHLRLIFSIFLCLLIASAAQAQIHPDIACSITGPTTVIQGSYGAYTLNGGCSASGWTTTCGTVTSSTSTTCQVYFNQTTCTSATIMATGTADHIVVTINPPVVGGTISNPSQTIGYNLTPAAIDASVATGGGCSSYNYQWYSSTDGTNFSSISGATAQNYQPPQLTVSTYFKRAATCTPSMAYTSNTALVTVNPIIVPGSISPSNPAINYNTNPGQQSLSGVSGGNGTYSYQWQSSASSSFSSPTTISGAISTTYTPGNLTATTYYRVAVTSNGATMYSAINMVTVYAPVSAGTISPGNQTINYNTAPAVMSVTGQSGGNGLYNVVWMSSPSSGGTYTTVGTGSTYAPGALTASAWYEEVTTSDGISATSPPTEVTVNPQVFPGAVTPAALTIAAGTSPGVLTVAAASGGACGGNFVYQWQSSTDDATWTNISGATALTYSPGVLNVVTYYRVQVTCGTDIENGSIAQITIPANLNYIRTRTLSKPGVTDTVTADGLTSTTDVQQSTTYFDGLGRSIQTVAMQASPLQHDMVSMQVYDAFDREATHYLPYTSALTDGNYKVNPTGEQTSFNTAQFPGEQYYYGQTVYEPSPLNRVSETYAAGMSWVGASRGIGAQFLINSASDSVPIWTISFTPGSLPVTSANFPAGELYKSVTTDEAGHTVIQYQDQQGKVLLKKVQFWTVPAAGPSGWLDTYYVYDDLDNLRYVIPPAAERWLQANSWNFAASGGSQVAFELCFRYEYDYRKHMSIKKVPGAGEAWMVYDGRDRLVMTQDSNLRVQGKWLVDEYDSQNRPDSAGLMTDSHNLTYHQNLAVNSSYYPVVAGYPYQLQTVSFYDNYNWVPTGGALSSTMNTSNNTNSSYFITGYNTSPTYAQPITYFPITRGQLTGTFAYVIGSTTGQVMVDVNFYDDRNRVIQTEAVNITEGVDLTTMQYDFSGKPLRTVLIHKNNDLPTQQHIVVTKLNYDPAFRLKSIFKNIDGAATDQLIDSMQYNELGQLRAKYLGNNVDSLVYAYNIRGWLTGINPNYVAGTATNYFGMELGYDKTTSVAPGNSYATQQYNGNIEGTVWKSAGSGVNRKYDFSYDAVNRLTGANFNQYNGSTFDQSAGIGFNVSNLSYDANGNIMSMTQQGFTVGGSNPIDVLTYTYLNNNVSNRLQSVVDGADNPTSQLGDFHYTQTNKQTTAIDYTYDGDGNLFSDNNKAIDSIRYNYLNLPDSVHMKGKGYIVYTYDAKGTKWKKTITDSLARHSTTILYLGGFVYQQNDSINKVDGGVDTLQFIAHEEGRARWAYHKYLQIAPGYRLEYDFFEKDHLGNTRMVLTQEHDTTNYVATMEQVYRPTESQIFGNIASTCVAWTSMPNYANIPNNLRFSVTSPNDSVSKVDYTGTSGQTTGPSLLLKVMAGDTITPSVRCYYVSNTITATNSSLTSVLNSLASGILGTPTGAAEGSLSGYTSSAGPIYGALSSFLSIKDTARTSSSYPKAYLNWILLDDQFNYVSSSSGSVAAASTTYPAGQFNLVAPGGPVVMGRNGYLYVWVSNETQGWDVFFDNFDVWYQQGPVLEENHYYPFGLTMAGISDKAVKTQYAQNKFRYNGKELQNQEFSDGSGLEEYDYGARMQDPQLGVWHGIDPHLEFYEALSPYSYCFDNPARYFDMSGNDPGDILIFFTGANIGQPRTASTGWMANQVSRFINGGTTQTYRSRPFGSWYWNSNTNEAYDAIVENHKNYPDGRVVIYGYSYGGQLANYLAKRLDKIGIKVDLLITTDAAAGTSSNSVDRTISGNVGLNVNFFEYLTTSIDPLPNHGASNTALSKTTTVLNFDMTGQKFTDDAGEEEKINHITIDDASKAASVNYMMAALPPRQQPQKNINILDWLNAAGVQWQYDSGQSSSSSSNSGKQDFKILFGVY